MRFGAITVSVDGPLAEYADGFRRMLIGRGYRPRSIEGQLRLMAHLSRWMEGQGLEGNDLTLEVVQEFLDSRRASGHREYVSVTPGLAPILDHLREGGAVPPPAPAIPHGPEAGVLGAYEDYLVHERGLAATTTSNYLSVARRFVAVCASEGSALTDVSAGQVSEFVLVECRMRRSGGAVADLVVGMRSFLRYLHLTGVAQTALAGVVPAAAYPPSGSPAPPVDPDQAAVLLRCCDRRTASGRRDFAMLTLMLRLGLRVGEVAALRLDDLDWRHGEVLIRGKGHRQERLPMPADVGEAVAGWLRRGRPRCDCLGVFTTVRAPLGALASGTVSSLVARAARRAGLPGVTAHRLRYFAATELLRAGGEFPEVQQVLRHANMRHTAAYAKVDQVALTVVARPWPTAGGK